MPQSSPTGVVAVIRRGYRGADLVIPAPGGPHADRGQGPPHDDLGRHPGARGKALRQGGQAGVRARDAGGRAHPGAEPVQPGRVPGGEHAPGQGHDAARHRLLARHGPLDQPLRRRAGGPGQAPPRQAAQAKGVAGGRHPAAGRGARRCGGHLRGPVVATARGADRRCGSAPTAGPSPTTLRPMGLLDRALNIGETKQFRQYEKRVARIADFEPELELESDEELKERMEALRQHVRSQPTDEKVTAALDEVLPGCFAIAREGGRRTMNMRHFDVQLIGGMVLHGGNIAEMRTGEGKTLTGTLAVVLNSLAGKGVHVVTVNDYLAKRDAEWMMPLYEACGVTVGILQNNMDPEDKVEAYACDVTYGTNSEFGFDYLRDNMAQSMEDKVQHGGRLGEDGRPLAMHYYAIVDEVDNILIDEARTPLIISGAPEAAAEHYVQFAKLAKTLKAGKTPEGMDPRTRKEFVADFDYEYEEKHKTVAITEQGVAKAEKFLGIDHLNRAENGPLVNHLIQALKAESLYKRDVDYAVVDNEVKIIDEFTGGILDGRRWSEGLHQAVEAKE